MRVPLWVEYVAAWGPLVWAAIGSTGVASAVAGFGKVRVRKAQSKDRK